MTLSVTSIIIWTPYKITYINELESVQHKFLRYVAFKMGTALPSK